MQPFRNTLAFQNLPNLVANDTKAKLKSNNRSNGL